MILIRIYTAHSAKTSFQIDLVLRNFHSFEALYLLTQNRIQRF